MNVLPSPNTHTNTRANHKSGLSPVTLTDWPSIQSSNDALLSFD